MHGDALSGRVLEVGADWQTVFDDGLAELDTRYAMETHDGAVIEIINYGLRHGPPEVMAAVARGEDVPAEQYYMRTHARLETGDERYAGEPDAVRRDGSTAAVVGRVRPLCAPLNAGGCPSDRDRADSRFRRAGGSTRRALHPDSPLNRR